MKSFTKPILILLPFFFFLHTQAILFSIRNNCSQPLWAAAVPGGGRLLESGQTWTLNFTDGPNLAKIWGRTNCTFDAAGRGTCLTGDCEGQLECESYGAPPHTLAEYGLNTFAHEDYYGISLMKGFNVPMEFTPISNGCNRSVRCDANITADCPAQLTAPGGCHNPCQVYNTTQYCCGSGACRPTNMSRFFKERCLDVFTYPEDDPTSTFTCPEGTNYSVLFCP